MERIKLTSELRGRGFATGEINRMSRAGGALRRIRRGAYGEPVVEIEPRIAHLELLEATLRQSSAESVASHMSAAAVHGLPLWTNMLDRVQLTRDRPGGLKKRRYSLVRGLPLDADEVVVVDGIQVTSLARTVFDLGCQLTMQQAVPIGDAAVRLGLPAAAIDLALDRGRGRHGIGRAKRSLCFLDGRAESPGESVSRVVFFEVGLPEPDLQVEVRDADDEFVGRCDFGWEECNTVGEYDGKIKYGRTLNPEQAVEDVVFEEKRREDAIRDTGRQMARWVWADLDPPKKVEARLRRAFTRGRRAA